jgi:hypothetical protein
MPKRKKTARRKITYRELEKQVIEEIGVLLEIQQRIVADYSRGKRPKDRVPDKVISKLQKRYSDSGPEMTVAAMPEGTRRARVSC